MRAVAEAANDEEVEKRARCVADTRAKLDAGDKHVTGWPKLVEVLGERGRGAVAQATALLGIGFGLSPDIDVTAGVSSVYLLVAEQTGLLGLGAYLAALLTTWWAGARSLARIQEPELQGVQAAFLAALSGALVAGMLDQYFANQTFPHAVALFWLYAAVLIAASRLRQPYLPPATV